MASSRQLKTKLRAVGNIKQMTSAMELVAATKMRKSQQVALAARPYAKKALSLLRNLLLAAGDENLMGRSHFFPASRDPAQRDKRTGAAKVCIVVVTSDRGLCGAHNSSVLREALGLALEHPEADIVPVGRKAHEFFRKRARHIAASFTRFSDVATLNDAEPLATFVLKKYKNHEYDRVFVCSTMFISALQQRVRVLQVLPLDIQALEKIIQGIVPKMARYSEYQNGDGGDGKNAVPYVFEPSRALVFEKLVEELVKVEIVHLVFEANASEHSSRMIAMKNATDNAEDLLASLTLALHKARQASITQELAEITSAKEALTSE